MLGITAGWLLAIAGSLIGSQQGETGREGERVLAAWRDLGADAKPGLPMTIDAAIEGLYASISGPAGQPRDWEAFDAILTDDARMAAFAEGPEGKAQWVVLTPEDYKTRSGPFLVERGFTEKETHRVMEVYGSVAHAWSTYKGTFDDPEAEGGKATLEGINSIQLVKLDGRWRVMNIHWESTQTAGPIPADYAGE